jgi:hypothetical protein
MGSGLSRVGLCAIHPSEWRNCLENQNGTRIEAPKRPGRGRKSLDWLPLASKDARSRSLLSFSKQFRKVDSPKRDFRFTRFSEV